MLKRSISWGVLFALTASTALAQTATPTIENLQTSAKALAGTDWPGTYLRLCIPTGSAANRVTPTINPNDYPTIILPTPPGGTPPRENWYAEPAQVGDNLYFLGTRNHNTYALVADTGEIILIDGNFDYATEAEIHQGLRILGLDPNMVRYLIIAHAHSDHDGGAHLTEAAIPGVIIVYGEGDWPDVLARTGPHATRFGPENDGTDGRVITVGDVSVQIVTMPGHTPGTISMLFEFMDNGRPIRVAYSGRRHRDLVHGPGSRLLRRLHRLGQEVRGGGSRVRRHGADVESHRVRQRLLPGAYSGQSLRHKCAQSVSRRSAGGAQLHGCRRTLRHGGQAAGDRQPLVSTTRTDLA